VSDLDDFADRDRDDWPPKVTPIRGDHDCRACKQPAPMLHPDPDRPNDPHRTICGVCQGERNRRIVDSNRPNKSDAPHETARKGSW